jgi:hypothetical protein
MAVAASALLSCVAAWLAQHGPAHRPATAAPAPAMVVRAEAPAAVIRLRPRVAAGRACTRLLAAREHAAWRGGSVSIDAARQDAPGRVDGGAESVVFSRGADEDWPGMAGGDAGQP